MPTEAPGSLSQGHAFEIVARGEDAQRWMARGDAYSSGLALLLSKKGDSRATPMTRDSMYGYDRRVACQFDRPWACPTSLLHGFFFGLFFGKRLGSFAELNGRLRAELIV